MAYVMIVDDDEDFAAAAAKVLQGAGHEVGIEVDPDQALSRMEERCPDLAILDVMFPESSSAGFELARTLRGPDSAFREMPLLMLTAVNSRFPLGFSARDIDDEWLPVNDFLEKPVDLDLLAEKTQRLLDRAEAERQG